MFRALQPGPALQLAFPFWNRTSRSITIPNTKTWILTESNGAMWIERLSKFLKNCDFLTIMEIYG
jgi:hypothetical protein